jgi:allophanate hydrolase subunit 1
LNGNFLLLKSPCNETSQSGVTDLLVFFHRKREKEQKKLKQLEKKRADEQNKAKKKEEKRIQKLQSEKTSEG